MCETCAYFFVVVGVLAARSIPYCHFGPNRIDLFGGQRSNGDDNGAVPLQYDVDVDVDAYKKKLVTHIKHV